MYIRRLIFLATSILFILTISSCAEEEKFNFDEISGTWIGTYNLVQTGSCPINTPENELALDIFHLGNGSINATQKFFDSNTSSWQRISNVFWDGTIEENVLMLTKKITARCNGEEMERVVEFTSEIDFENEPLELSFGANEIWCPQQNCTFRSTYKLTKN